MFVSRRSLFTTLLSPLAAQQESRFRAGVSLVNVPFTITATDGKLVDNLTAADFEVLEDGIPQKIAFFSRAAESSLSLAIVVDVSPSQERFLRDHRRHLREFLDTILRGRDSATLLCFGANVYEVSPPSSQAARLEEALHQFQKAKSVSAYPKLSPPEIREDASSVFDAIVAGAKALSDREGRRAIVLFSDGEDTSSAAHLLDAIETAQEHSATILSVCYSKTRQGRLTARNKQGRGVMQRLSKETGGLAVNTDSGEDLHAAFVNFAELLRNSYYLGYASTQSVADGSFRKIAIRCRRPGLSARHKTGYYSRPE